MDKFTKFQIYKIAAFLEYTMRDNYGNDAVRECISDAATLVDIHRSLSDDRDQDL